MNTKDVEKVINVIVFIATAKKLGYTGAVALGEALNSHTKLTELNMWSLLPIIDIL